VHDVRGTHALLKVAAGGSGNGPSVAEECEDPRLVENAPMLDAIAERFDNELRVNHKKGGQIAIWPTPHRFQGLWEIPVIERADGTDFRFEQSVGDALVVVEAFLIGWAGAVGLDARPADREAAAL